MRALSIRQPWAELILLSHKTIEVRSLRTHIRERIYIYAGLGRIDSEVEARIARKFEIDTEELPRGVLVGTVEIVDCRPLTQSQNRAALRSRSDETEGQFAWILERPERARALRKPKNRPQPVFF